MKLSRNYWCGTVLEFEACLRPRRGLKRYFRRTLDDLLRHFGVNPTHNMESDHMYADDRRPSRYIQSDRLAERVSAELKSGNFQIEPPIFA